MNEDLKLVLDELRSFKTDVNAKFDEVHNEIRTFKTDVNAKFDEVNARLNKMDSRLDSMDSRMDKLEYQVKWNFDETLALLHVMDEKINDVKADVKDVKTRLELTESITKQNTYDITLLRAKA